MSPHSLRFSRLIAASSVVTMACAESGGTAEPAVDDMDLFATAGKTDDGRVSDQPTELECELAGKVTIDVGALAADEQARLTAAARAGDTSAFETWPTEQVKFARNVLRREGFSANIEGGDRAVISVALADDQTTIEVVYQLVVRSLVDLEEMDLTTTQLVGATLQLALPADPRTAFVWGGLECAEDPVSPATDIASAISAYNYFHYWKPDKAGCPVALEEATFTVKGPSAAPLVWPEYDQLLADKTITMVVLFGQLEQGELWSGTGSDRAWDLGWVAYDEFTDWLDKDGYTERSRAPEGAQLGEVASSRWSKRYVLNELTVEIDVVSPLELQDHADAARKDQIVASAVKNHEIVYFNGHSFYGSLKVLADPASFPSDYQIVFMDGCWSYADSTKQVFRSKANASDPDGLVKVDVLANTVPEPMISGWSFRLLPVFLDKLFTAATHVANQEPSKAKNYSWQNLVRYLNATAQQRFDAGANEWAGHAPEVYGVSGVATNVWKP